MARGTLLAIEAVAAALVLGGVGAVAVQAGLPSDPAPSPAHAAPSGAGVSMTSTGYSALDLEEQPTTPAGGAFLEGTPIGGRARYGFGICAPDGETVRVVAVEPIDVLPGGARVRPSVERIDPGPVLPGGVQVPPSVDRTDPTGAAQADRPGLPGSGRPIVSCATTDSSSVVRLVMTRTTREGGGWDRVRIRYAGDRTGSAVVAVSHVIDGDGWLVQPPTDTPASAPATHPTTG